MKLNDSQTPSRIDWYSGKYGFNMLGKIVEIPFSTNSIKCNALFGFIGVADDESLIQQLAVGSFIFVAFN